MPGQETPERKIPPGAIICGPGEPTEGDLEKVNAFGAFLAGLPPKWHDAEYAQRKTEGIRNRPPIYCQNLVLNDDIDWLLEEIGWLNKQLAEARAAITERSAT